MAPLWRGRGGELFQDTSQVSLFHNSDDKMYTDSTISIPKAGALERGVDIPTFPPPTLPSPAWPAGFGML